MGCITKGMDRFQNSQNPKGQKGNDQICRKDQHTSRRFALATNKIQSTKRVITLK